MSNVSVTNANAIYLDYQATTPLDPEVFESMLPYLKEQYGNASSQTHAWGWTASAAIDQARKQVASLLGAQASEVVFTSGSTESNNLAIRGLFEASQQSPHPKTHFITSAIEHKSVLDTCKSLENRGATVTVLPVDAEGRINTNDLEQAITPNTLLVSILFANNEIGTVQDIGKIGRICREKSVLFHTDAVQAVGKISIDLKSMPIDMLSMSAHKVYGPKGVGALYVRKKDPRVILAPLFTGGGQEGGLRAGTQNVPGIVGLGKACSIMAQKMESENQRLEAFRTRIWNTLHSKFPFIKLNGSLEHRISSNLNICFYPISGEVLMSELRGICLSSGSACNSGSAASSHVVRAIGRSDAEARSSLRISLGRMTTEEQVQTLIKSFECACTELSKSLNFMSKTEAPLLRQKGV